MPETWPPPPAVEDFQEMGSEPDEYEDMPGLDQITPSQTAVSPDSDAPAMPSAQPVQSSQDSPGVPSLTLPTHWGPPPAGMPPETFTDIFAASGLTQEALNSAVPPMFFTMNHAANAAVPSMADFFLGTGLVQQTNSFQVLSNPSMPPGFAAMLAALSNPHEAEHGGDAWEDVPEDTDEDDDDDMPALENMNPLTTPVPVDQQANMMASSAESMAAMGGPHGPSFPPHAPLSSGEMPEGPFTTLQDVLPGSSNAPTENAPNGSISAQAAMLPAYPMQMSFTVSAETNLAAGNVLNSGSFIVNNSAELAAQIAAAGADVLDPLTGEPYAHLHTHFWHSGGPLPDGSSSVEVGPLLPAAAELLAPIGFTTNNETFSWVFTPLGMATAQHHRANARPHFDAVAFVDTLEPVDTANIPAEDMRCPYCWLPFGTTDEDDPSFTFAPDPDDPPEVAARQIAFREVLPFCADRADNDPVRTPCGHLFGRGCLVETMEKVDTLCPTCRKEMCPKPEIPNPMD